MARQLHKIKNKDLYALYSTIVDDYVTKWLPKKEIKEIWLREMVAQDEIKINNYMEEVDEEFDEIPIGSDK